MIRCSNIVINTEKSRVRFILMNIIKYQIAKTQEEGGARSDAF